MSYRRFEIPALARDAATVANLATLPQTVANVATVARGEAQAAEPPAGFSDLYETEADYAKALIRYARQDGLSLTIKDERLIIGIGAKSDAGLLGELRKHERTVIEALTAEPALDFRPPLKRVPPFGCDAVPERCKPTWEALLAQCRPSERQSRQWNRQKQAISDAADLFSIWGTQDGLVWFMHGSPVMALGKGVAQLQDGRIFDLAVSKSTNSEGAR
jgi:hypothetical protein